MPLQVTSPAFAEGQVIPRKYTGDGDDLSPPLAWSAPPAGTASLALICDDPDAPRGTWVHWVLYNLPGDLRGLDEATPTQKSIANGALQGINDFGNTGYGGPAPPPGKPHQYYFKLYALDAKLPAAAGLTKQQLLDAMKGHVVAEGAIMGTYKR
jgi:Raf kinase inhibitor-like YbhB/YbcL family protein